MIVKVKKPAEPRSVAIDAIPSKSAGHRLLIAAALSGVDIVNEACGISQDIDATKDCLSAVLGASACQASGEAVVLEPRESGSTLRFLVPVVAALGIDADFHCKGRLADRPMEIMRRLLEEHGCSMSPEGSNPIEIRGKLQSGEYRLPGNVSSQYVTGLLMALPLLEGDSSIQVEGILQSRPYVDLTLEVIREAGIEVSESENETGTRFDVRGNQAYTMSKMSTIEGDWSNAAFWLVLDAIWDGSVDCRGLRDNSSQGDKEIRKIIDSSAGSDELVIDVGDIPDLVPIVSVLACARSKGAVTRIVNAERLRYKESDRLVAVADIISKLGGQIEELKDGLVIKGTETLKGGEIDSFNDHRIAMSAAIAAVICDEAVIIRRAEAVSKSYPRFFEDYQMLCGNVEILEK